MRRFAVALLLPLVLAMTGCGMTQSTDTKETAGFTISPYSSNTSTEDCYLCGGGIEKLIPSRWGQDNIALISLNTFEIKPLEINRYDRDEMLEEYVGSVSFGGGSSEDSGFSANLLQDHDRGYAAGTVDFYKDEILDVSRMAGFLCEDCLNEILPKRTEKCFGVGAVSLATKEVRIFEESFGGFGLGDFYIDYDLHDLDGGKRQMSIIVFYCPIRYAEQS